MLNHYISHKQWKFINKVKRIDLLSVQTPDDTEHEEEAEQPEMYALEAPTIFLLFKIL